MAFWDKETLVGEFEKNGSGNTYKVKIVEKDERKFVDFREFFTNKDGEDVPTRKGVAIPADVLVDVIAHLEMAKVELED